MAPSSFIRNAKTQRLSPLLAWIFLSRHGRGTIRSIVWTIVTHALFCSHKILRGTKISCSSSPAHISKVSTYDATATWTGDCEDQAALAVAVWRAMAESRAAGGRGLAGRLPPGGRGDTGV